MQKIDEGSISLAEGEARPLDGPTEVGTGLARPQSAPLSHLIDTLNSRFGTDFNQSDQLFFDQIVEAAVSDDGLQRAAAVNPSDKFELLFGNLVMDLFDERIDQNEEIFARMVNEESFRRVVTTWMASEAYGRLRRGAKAEETARDDRGLPPRLRLVVPQPVERYRTCVPLVPLKVAAGAFSDSQQVDEGSFDWVAIETNRHLREGMFVAQVVGKSMEPNIRDGAFCLFVAPVPGTRQGKTVLVQMREATDPESGERYTVKRYESEKAGTGDSWQHTRISLKPINADFAPIVLTGSDDHDVQELAVVAELVEVLD